MGWFKKSPDLGNIRPDVGPPPQKTFGLTGASQFYRTQAPTKSPSPHLENVKCVAGVGSSPYVMNCNVTIDTQDIAVGRVIATAIRESTPGGLPGVQVLALPHEGAVEIACNVESVTGSPPRHGDSGEPWPSFSIDGQTYRHVPASLIAARVAELAGEHGVTTKATALVGFTPHQCRGLAELALTRGIAEFWRELHRIHM